MRKPISVVLVDDQPSGREGVVAQVCAQPGFKILATLADVEAALQTVKETKPDIVLLNLQQEGDDSLTLAGALHGETPRSRVVVMGLLPNQDDVTSLVRAGVSGFIMRDASFDEYLSTLRSVAEGVQVLPLQLTRSLFGQLNKHGEVGRSRRTLDTRRLTDREQEVADLIVQGLSNKEISARLMIALHTVKSHVHKVLSKLSVNSRLEVAAFSQNLAPTTATAHPPAESGRAIELVP
jgi:DNA-binding NarL/FixJ family response regulator